MVKYARKNLVARLEKRQELKIITTWRINLEIVKYVKRKHILQRDKEFCQLCIRNLYETLGRTYNYKLIEVHHMKQMNENYDLMLEDHNLIYLCTYDHKKADREKY